MAVTRARIDMKDVYLYVLSHQNSWNSVPGESEPDTIVSLGFRFGNGNFSYSLRREFNYIPERGRMENSTMTEGDEVPMDIQFNGVYETLYGDDNSPSIYELLMGRGDCAGWAGLGDNPCEPYAVSLVLVNDPLIRVPTCGEGEILLFENFFCAQADPDLSAQEYSFQGQSKSLFPVKLPWNDPSSIPGWQVPSIHIHE